MKVTITEACGILHEVDAEITGVDSNGIVCYQVTLPFTVDPMHPPRVVIDVLPSRSSLSIVGEVST